MSDSIVRPGRLRSAVVRIVTALVVALGVTALGAAPAALAGPCQTCPPPPPGSEDPRPPTPTPPLYQLTVHTVIAHEVEDDFEDELYVKFNGTKVYGSRSINPLQGWFGLNLQKVYANSVEVALYDEDGIDPDDSLGKVTFYATGTSTPQNRTVHLYGSGAHYELRTVITKL